MKVEAKIINPEYKKAVDQLEYDFVITCISTYPKLVEIEWMK